MKDNGTLVKGRIYDPDALCCIGWTVGDGSGHRGYDYRDYFRERDADSWEYLGADCHKIEPRFSPLESYLTPEDAENDIQWANHTDP